MTADLQAVLVNTQEEAVTILASPLRQQLYIQSPRNLNFQRTQLLFNKPVVARPHVPTATLVPDRIDFTRGVC